MLFRDILMAAATQSGGVTIVDTSRQRMAPNGVTVSEIGSLQFVAMGVIVSELGS